MLERAITPRRLPFLLSLALLLFAFLLYRNTVPNGYTVDDNMYYTDNKFVQQGLKGMKMIFTKSPFFGFNGTNDKIYRPLPLACFALQHALYGNNPHFNHFVNVFLYAACCALLLLLLRGLFAGTSLSVPFCITLLFTAHPIHTEVVANIKGQDELLALLFSILTFLFLFLYNDRKRPVFIAAGTLSFLLCLLCKEHGLTMLGTLPLALYVFRSTRIKKIALMMSPLCIAVLAYIIFRNSILDNFTFGKPLGLINNTLMAAHSSADRLATAFLILGKYLRLLIIPWPLCWNYSYNQIPVTTWADPRAILSLVIYAGMLVSGIIGAVKKNRLAFAALFFLFSFSLSSNLFLKISTTLAERLLFTPSIGFCIAAVIIFSKIAGRLRFRIPLAAAMMGIVVVLYAIAVINRNTDWKDNFTLVSRDIVKNPGCAPAHNALGAFLLYDGSLEKRPAEKSELLSRATAEFRRSVAIFPGYAAAWNNLGIACNEAGRPEDAIDAYRTTLALEPKMALTANNLGIIYFKLKRYDSAAVFFRKAISADPGNASGYVNLIATEFLLKNYDAALAAYQKAIERDPHNMDARREIRQFSLLLKDTALARQYREAAAMGSSPVPLQAP
jgi:protein O-mannosyl-transferase